MAYSCRMGISSFAYDNAGAGRTQSGGTSLPSTDIQMPVAANVSSALARDLKNGRVSSILTGVKKKYQKVVGIGHSLGSLTFNHAVIAEGARSPFDGLVLTGNLLVFFPQSPHPPLRSIRFGGQTLIQDIQLLQMYPHGSYSTGPPIHHFLDHFLNWTNLPRTSDPGGYRLNFSSSTHQPSVSKNLSSS